MGSGGSSQPITSVRPRVTSTATSSDSARPFWRPGTLTHDRFEHFGWGITPELAVRLDRRPGDLEIDIDRRRDYLAGLAEAGIAEVDAVRAAIDGFRTIPADATGVPARN